MTGRIMNSRFRCTGCKNYFPSETRIKINTGSFHSLECATEHGRAKSKKAIEKQRNDIHKALKKKVSDNDKSGWTKKAQQVFNKYIRQRDNDLPCISCGRYHGGQYHAGHFLTVGANPSLRFDHRNCHKQCAPCNNHLSGNIPLYRKNLIIKIGLAEVEWLEGPHEPKRYTVDNLKTIIKWYKRKIKRMEQC